MNVKEGTEGPEERTTDGIGDAASPAATVDSVFAGLADGRRRMTIRLLASRTRPVAVADVARSIANRDRTDADYPDDEEQLYLELTHVHVPKLVDIGLLEYNQERNTIEGTDAIELAVRLLASFEQRPAES